MTLTTLQRRVLLFAALAAAIGVVRLGDGDESPPLPAALAERAPAAPAKAAPAAAELPEVDLERLAQKVLRDPVRDAFEERSWEPPPPPPPPRPAPKAPPLPFTYTGKIMEAGQIVVFLAKQDRNYVVRVGDTLDQQYRVDDIKPAQMTLTYLPLDQKQTLAIGAAN